MVPVNIYLVYNLYLPVLFPFISCSLDFILILSFTRWTYFDLLSRRDMPLRFSCHWYIYCVESCGDFLSSSITASSPHDLSWKGLAEDSWYNCMFKTGLTRAGHSGPCSNARPYITLNAWIYLFFFYFFSFCSVNSTVSLLLKPLLSIYKKKPKKPKNKQPKNRTSNSFLSF